MNLTSVFTEVLKIGGGVILGIAGDWYGWGVVYESWVGIVVSVG